MELIDLQIKQLIGGITPNEVARGAANNVSNTYKSIAAVATGNPSRAVMGPTTAEMLEVTAQSEAIKVVRSGLPSGAKTGGNVAVADINIAGLPARMSASSQINEVGNGVIGEGSGNFVATEAPNVAGQSIPRTVDSEYKILDNVADKLGNNSGASGSIRILTERPACDSCLSVVDQFKAKYPNIEVKVYDTNGVLLTPRGPKITPSFNPNKPGALR